MFECPNHHHFITQPERVSATAVYGLHVLIHTLVVVSRRTDLWPKPIFAVTPESLSGPVIWQKFFAYLAKAKIPTYSLRVYTRAGGGIRAFQAFEVEYLESFDKTCRVLIERASVSAQSENVRI